MSSTGQPTPSPTPTPWTQTMTLRPEIVRSGHVDDVQVSLAAAVFGASGDQERRSHYARPDYYGAITHPTGRLVNLMAQVKLRIGGSGPAARNAPAVWRLDQAMGGGKSHGLIGLWHLAEHPEQLAETELGQAVDAEAAKLGGAGAFAENLGQPVCVVLDCDNPAPSEPKDGPARTLGERFLWRLLKGAYKKWDQHRAEIVNKAKIAEVLESMGVPVLILIDEVMDYLRWAESQPDSHTGSRTDSHQPGSNQPDSRRTSNQPGSRLLSGDMAFLRSLLDAVNDIDNCALVVVMIASESDTMALSPGLEQHRGELESLLVRNGTTTTVTSGGDFGAILRRRLFTGPPPDEVVDATGRWHAQHMRAPGWDKAFSDANMPVEEFRQRLQACYPFHPSLIKLAQDHWSQHAGFQKVRSTIQVFAGAVHALHLEAGRGRWAPSLIGPGDLVLDDSTLREALLSSGLVTGQRIQSSLREICTGDICDPDNPERGTARAHDLRRGNDPSPPAWADASPRASERAATALLVYTISPRPQGARGATGAEMLTATFVPHPAYGIGDAEAVWQRLQDANVGLAALDSKDGSGPRPKRWWLETRATLRMLHRRELEAVSDADRDLAVTERAFGLAVSGPFASKRFVTGKPDRVPPSADDLCALIEAAGLDDGRKTRLAVLDSRWFSLLNGVDAFTRLAVRSAFGVAEAEESPDRLMPLLPPRGRPMTWASSCVFAVINTQMRARARRLASNFLARERVGQMDLVRNDPEMRRKARKEHRDADKQFDKIVRQAYQHVLYLAEDSNRRRVMRSSILSAPSETALDGAAVWEALCDEGKTLPAGAAGLLPGEASLDARALLHNLSEGDWGRPLSEIRDDFWKAPRLPLLPGGEKDLRQAILEAVTAGDMRIVDEDGAERAVVGVADLNLASSSLRIAKPAPPVAPFAPDTTSASATADGVSGPAPAAPGLAADGASGPSPGDKPVGTPGDKPVDAPAAPTEPGQRFKAAVITRFDDPPRPEDGPSRREQGPSRREQVFALLNVLAEAVDEDAEYASIHLELVAPAASIARLAAAAESADITYTVTDL